MTKEQILSTLFVGIDVSSQTNVVCAIDFFGTKHIRCSVLNNNYGANELVSCLAEFLKTQQFSRVVIVMESTSVYSTHIASFLSTAEPLTKYTTEVYCVNPKNVANYKKSYGDIGKTDNIDAFIIVEYARNGRVDVKPWRGTRSLALQRLTCHRLHLADSIAREKAYMLTNIFLKFSEFAVANKEEHPFSNKYGATAEAVLREFLSTDDIVNSSPQDLADFVNKKVISISMTRPKRQNSCNKRLKILIGLTNAFTNH